MFLGHCRRAILLTGLFGTLVTGCGQSNARFQWARATLARNARGVDVVRFDAAIMVKGMAGRQAIYEVCVDACDGKPVMSRDEYYRNRRGQVAAARTFPIGLPIQQVSDLSVSIPVSQLEAADEQLPIAAKMTIYTSSGEPLTTTRCPIPDEALPKIVTLRESEAVVAP